ncbi:MAG: TlpA disulfide reductase family protein [Planctomycetota bacterium]|jgi:thiol-disulfide isomerase/thioredoxin|nr:TlpA disulfide reductase family protein [Planctomycetota bacterium]
MLAITILSTAFAVPAPIAMQATPPAAPAAAKAAPSAEALQQRVVKLYETLNEKYAKVSNPTPEEIQKMQADVAAQADATLADLDFAALSDAQYAAVEPIIMMSPKASDAVKALRKAQAGQPTLAGLAAAIQAAGLSMRSPEELAASCDVLLSHPALAEGMKGEMATMALEILSQCPADSLKKHAAAIEKIGELFNADAPTGLLVSAESYLGVANGTLPKDKVDAVRAKALNAIDSRYASATGRDRKMLERAQKYLKGAAGRGELIGFTCPPLTCDWVMRADGTSPWKSIADLKGKVVVLDFWATWCGPCVGSFPKVAEMRSAYPADKLEIIGVTSLQGTVAHQKRDPVDCQGDAAKEHAELMTFMKDMGVTWTVAVTKEDVFNSDFGIRGIPFIAILDQDGKVVKVGLHPESEDEIRKTIDELLAKGAK